MSWKLTFVFMAWSALVFGSLIAVSKLSELSPVGAYTWGLGLGVVGAIPYLITMSRIYRELVATIDLWLEINGDRPAPKPEQAE